MKVYIVTYDNHWDEIFYVDAVFSTKEKAEAHIAETLNNMSDSLREESRKYYDIVEEPVN